MSSRLIDNEIPEPGDDRNKGGAFNVLQYNTIDQVGYALFTLYPVYMVSHFRGLNLHSCFPIH